MVPSGRRSARTYPSPAFVPGGLSPSEHEIEGEDRDVSSAVAGAPRAPREMPTMVPSTAGRATVIRRTFVLVQATLLAVSLAIVPASPAVAPAAAAGTPFGSLTCTALTALPVSANTGEKPQSKVWTHDGAWWAVLPTTSGNSGSGTWLWKLDGTTWTSVLKLSNDTDTHADVLDTGTVTHILLYSGTSSELVSVEYASGTYAPWSTRPAAAADHPRQRRRDRDDRRRLDRPHVARVGRHHGHQRPLQRLAVLELERPDHRSRRASTPTTSPSSPRFGGNKVGVLWSNQATQRFGFRVHADGDAAATWAADEVPASRLGA